MGGVFALLRGLAEDCEIAVLVVHHTRRASPFPATWNQRGAERSGGSIRIGLTLTVMSETEAADLGIPKETRKHYVRLDNAKQSYGPPSDGALWFHRYSVILKRRQQAGGRALVAAEVGRDEPGRADADRRGREARC